MPDMEMASLKVKFGTEGEDDTAKKVDSLGKQIDKVGTGAVKTGTMMTLGLTTPILAFGAASIMSASDTSESIAKVNTVYGDSAGAVLAWAGTTSTALGLSEQDALAATGTFGNMFTSMGMGQEEAANLSMGMVQLAVDTASFNNASTDDALLAMQSALTGEYEALKKYGIVLNETTLNQTAMNMGLGDNFNALTEQEKVLVRQQAIMDQSKNATGDFARTSDGLANQMKIAKATFEDITATIGAMFLPIVTKGMTAVAKWLNKFDELSPGMQKVMVAIVGVAAAIGPLLIGMGYAIKMAGTMASAIKGITTAVGLLTSPVGLVIVAIAGLVMLGIHLYKNWEPFRKLVDKIAVALKNFINGPVLAFIANLADRVGDAISAFKEWANGITSWTDLMDKVRGLLSDAGGWVKDLVNQIGNLDWNGLLKGAWSAIQTSLEFAWAQLSSIDWMAVIGKAVEVGQKILEWIKETLGDINWSAILGAAKEVGQAIFEWAQDKLGDIDWTKLFGAMKDLGGEILSWIKGQLGAINWSALFGAAVEIGSTVLNWIISAVSAINWSGLFGAAVEIGASILQWIKDTWGAIAWTDILGEAVALGASLWNWTKETLGAINWGRIVGAGVALGASLWNWTKETLGTIDWGRIVGAGVALGASLWNWTKDTLKEIDWGRIVGAAVEIGANLWDWMTRTLKEIDWGRMVGAAVEVGKSVFEWLKMIIGPINWADLFGAMIDLGKSVLDWLTGQITIPTFTWPSVDDFKNWFIEWLGPNENSGKSIPEYLDPTIKPGDEPADQVGFSGNMSGPTFDVKGAQNFAAMLAPVVAAANLAKAAVSVFNLEANKTPVILGAAQGAAPLYGGSITNAANQVQGGRVSIIGSLTAIANTTLQQMAAARATASTNIGAMMSDVTGKVTSMRNGAYGQLVGMTGDASVQSRSTMTNMISGIANGLPRVTSNFQTMKSNALSKMQAMAGDATSQGNTTMSNMVGALAGGMARVAWTLAGLSSAVSTAGANAADVASRAGANIGSSFASAMEAYLDRIRAAANAMADAASTALQARLAIQSPSKVFTRFGEYVGEGFEIGIRSMIPSVATATESLVAMPDLARPSGGALAGAAETGKFGTIVNQIFTLRGAELAQLIEQAQRGSDHAEAWQNPEAIIQFLKGL